MTNTAYTMVATLPSVFPPRRKIALHLLVWLAVAIAGVVLRGPVWDENYEFAQVLLDKVPYPKGHPEYFHVKNLFTLQLYQVALHLALGGSPEWICGVRNVLFTLAKTVPLFYLGLFLSRRLTVAHAAVLAGLLLGGQSFVNAYPASSWPVIPTNGMVGTGYALLTVVLLASGRYRSGFALAAAMPAVHVGQAPPLGLFTALVFLHLVLRHYRSRPFLPLSGAPPPSADAPSGEDSGPSNELRSAFIGIALGAPVTVISLAVAWYFHVPYTPEPAYTGTVSEEAVWRGFLLEYTDHQRLHLGPDFLCMLWSLWLLGTCWRFSTKRATRRIYGRLLLFAVLICAIVWPIMAVHARMGADTPHALLFWIPYRLPNHLPPLVAALTAILLLRNSLSTTFLLLIGGLSLSLLNYSQEEILTGLSAAAILYFAFSLRPWWMGIGWAVASILLWLLVLRLLAMPGIPFFYGLAAGALAVLIDHTRVERFYGRPLASHLASALLAIFVALSVFRPVYGSTPDLVLHDEFEAAIHTLEQSGAMRPDEMLCVPHIQRTLQGKLDHPVIAEVATLTWIPYHRELGPGLQRMFKDLYGLDLAKPEVITKSTHMAPPLGDWSTLWQERSQEEWRELGQRYDFRYVVVPSFLELRLEPVLTKGIFSLFRIPKSVQ